MPASGGRRRSVPAPTTPPKQEVLSLRGSGPDARVAAGVIEPLPQDAQGAGDALQLLEVQRGQTFERPLSGTAQAHAYHASVVGIGVAHHEPCRLCPPNEPDHAVLAQQQMVSDFAHCRPAGVAVASHCQEELMLRGRESHLGGPLLAPMQEASGPSRNPSRRR